jgi:hypothetical protein
MKRVAFTCIILCCFIYSTFATQWNISNHPSNPGQFNSITTALASSSVMAGDTFLIHPTGTKYPDFTLTKSITFIGGGFNTNNGQTDRSTIGRILVTGPIVDGSQFYGLLIDYFNVTDNSGTISNLKFEDCYFTSTYSPNEGGIEFRSATYPVNLFIRNCWFQTCIYTAPLKFNQNGGPVSSSVYVSNSIFSNCGVPSITGNRGVLIVNNCLFLTISPVENVKYATFENCIFNVGTFNANVTDNVFNNCISTNASLPPVNNVGANNISNTAVIFIPNTFKLAPNSPGYTGGSDGQQMGIYGGSSTFSSAGEPLITPITRYLNLSNTTVPYNGSVNINLLVTKPLKN